MSDHLELRKKIKDVQSDNSISLSEKNKQIQLLMNPSKLEIIHKTCLHYPNKKCNNFYFSCCNIVSDCIRCHNEISDECNKPVIDYIHCSNCNSKQSPSNRCVNKECDILFSKNYCPICKIWTDTDMTHCDKCKICRVGEKDKLFHCDKCDTCFKIESKESHICISISFRNQTCTFCLENVHASQNCLVPLKCGHIVHSLCLENALKMHQYRCPTCRKIIYHIDWSNTRDMILFQPMPVEDIRIGDTVQCTVMQNKLFIIEYIRNDFLYVGYFSDKSIGYGIFNKESLKKMPKKINIYCNDCEKECETLFHYIGNECMYCNGFNTIQL